MIDKNGNEIWESSVEGNSATISTFSIRLPQRNERKQIGHLVRQKGCLVYKKHGTHFLVEKRSFCMPKMLINHLLERDKNCWIQIECKKTNLWQKAKEFLTGDTVEHKGYEEQWSLPPEEFIEQEK